MLIAKGQPLQQPLPLVLENVDVHPHHSVQQKRGNVPTRNAQQKITNLRYVVQQQPQPAQQQAPPQEIVIKHPP